MATSPSPHLSPTLGAVVRAERNRSETPPAQPISKRDKRRTQLLDRLQEVTLQFTSNKDQYYRQHLQGLQLDTGLILHTNIYGDDPENDLSDAVEPFVYKVTGGDPVALSAVRERNIRAIGGKLWSSFVNDINETMENRDAALASHKVELDKKIAQFNTSKAFMTKLADEEHRALANTLRDRLINSVSGRKARLNKDKDSETISDSNALLMHPNQFSIANPSSPGGVLGKRATRHRRDVDDLPGMIDGHKRKRRAMDDSGSPVPSRRLLENGFSTPIWSTEQVANAANKGTGSPLYSIDKLFTEKELAMTYNQAAMAAQHFIVTHKSQDYDGSSPDGNDSNEVDGELADNLGDADHMNEPPDSPPEAPTMERQVSHATRSTRGQGGAHSLASANGIEAINFSELLMPSTFARMSAQMPKMPPLLSGIMSKPYVKDGANSPLGLIGDDLLQDLQRIERCKSINEEVGGGRSLNMPNGDRDLLEAAVAHPSQFPVWIAGEKKPQAAMGRGKRQTQYSNLRAEDLIMGGYPMSKQSSLGGSEMGGVPMSRTGTGDGSRRRGGRGA